MWEEEEIERILFYRNPKENSDKIYLVQIVQGEHEDQWIVKAHWGKRTNGPGANQEKAVCGRLAAEKEFNKLLEAKIKKGYSIGSIELVPRVWQRYCLTKLPR